MYATNGVNSAWPAFVVGLWHGHKLAGHVGCVIDFMGTSPNSASTSYHSLQLLTADLAIPAERGFKTAVLCVVIMRRL